MARLRQILVLPFKLLALTMLTLWIIPVQGWALTRTQGLASTPVARRFHRRFCAVLGIRVETCGVPVAGGLAMFACNHLSYLDVPVLGGIVDAVFVAKEDVRGWPLAGLLSRLQRTVFVSRDPRAASSMTRMMGEAFLRERRLVVFAEGTTSDGSSVLPFRSSAFAALADPSLRGVAVQPVSIALLEVDGRPVGAGAVRERYAYCGEATLVPHLLSFAMTSGARLRITFHAPLARVPGESRKTLAAQAHASALSALPDAAAGPG